MGLKPELENLERIGLIVDPMLQASRVPGAAIAIVSGGKIVFAKGFGYRDLAAKLPATADTVYPIASTTKPSMRC